MNDAAIVLLCAMLHMALIAAPGVAAALYAACRGVSDVLVLLAIGLVASGASAMLALWSYFSFRGLGLFMTFAVPAFSAIVVWRCAARLGWQFAWKQLATPLTLWMLGTLFLLFFGFLHGGVDQPVQMATTRFSHQLPSDNWLPLHFADGIYKLGNFRAPPTQSGEWLSSDRPPLQMGYVLAARPFGYSAPESLNRAKDIHYQVLCVALQQLWIIGMWVLLQAARVRAGTRWMILTAALVSDIAIVNGFYVWPKLMAAGFLFAAAAFILTDRWLVVRSHTGMGVLLASLFALAMLCHGSSVYALIPLVLVAALRGRPTRRWIGAGLLAAALLYGPWLVYQHYGDPPGNRLVKWMLAGQLAIDKRSTVDTIIDAYSRIGVGQTIENKLNNLNALTGGTDGVDTVTHAIRLAATGHFEEAIASVRLVRFFSLLQALGVLAFAPLVALLLRVRRRVPSRADWDFARRCFGLLAVACTAWVVLQFGDTLAAQAVIHEGSLAIPLVAIMACVAGLAAMSSRLAAIFVGVNVVLVLALYAPALTPIPGTSYSFVFGAGALAFLVGFIVIAMRSPDVTSATTTSVTPELARS